MTPEGEAPWDKLRIEEELRRLREHAEAVRRATGGNGYEPKRKTWTETFAPWIVPTFAAVAIASVGWVIHQHELAAAMAKQYADQQTAQDLKLTGMEVRLLAMEQTIQAQRQEQEKIAMLAATVNILTTESSRARDRLERLEQRR